MNYFQKIKTSNINEMAVELTDISKNIFDNILTQNNLQIQYYPSFLGLWVYILTSEVEDEIHN